MRRQLTAWIVLLFIIGSGIIWLKWQLSDTIWTVILRQELSPDGAWKSSIEETVSENTFVTSIIDKVYLTSVRDPTQAVEVLTVATDGHASERPRIAWTAPDILQVTAANLSYVTRVGLVFETAADFRFRHVVIRVRFDPDDPAARAAWLRDECAKAVCG